MPDIQFPDASPYNPNVKFGERPSAFDFVPSQYWSGVRAGTLTTDLTGWIQDGLDSLGGVGGGIFYMPWGVYPVKDIDCPSGVEIVGDGRRRTFMKRIATLPAGRGVLNFAGNGSAVRKLGIDGMVTVPVGYTYAELTDPMEYKLTVDTSIWVHSGASNITIAQTLVYHSGGYAVLVDATTGDVRRVLLSDDDFENNRPNTAGMPGDTTAGGWGGGVHYQGDGVSHSVNGLHVDKSRFRRGTGNQLWGHLYAFGKLHTDIKATGCHFSDIGRDGIMLGGVSGGVVSDCHFRRIGYVCMDDTAPIGTPKWVSNQWAVGLDTAGLVRGVNYTNNTFLNCLGACMDGDGYAEGTVAGNICRVSKPDEPEYAEDNVAAWPGNYCYGFQSSNSNRVPPDNIESIAWAARGINVTGNYFYNMGLGAVRLYAARKSNVRGNTIWHPDGALAVPIILGNIGNGENQRAHDNSVSENDIYWNPGASSPVVYEDKNSFEFATTDKNWIAGNRLFGTNIYEFRKDPGTVSITGRVYSSNVAGLLTRSENYWQRENGYFRLYRNDDAFLTILDQFAVDPSVGSVAGPLLNISKNAAGGVITTGPRTTLAWNDSIGTGKLYADCLLALADTTFTDPAADLMDDSVALFKYDAPAHSIKYSVTKSGSSRIWQNLTGGAVPGGVSGSVQYNNGAGGLAGDDFLKWDKDIHRATITGAGETPATTALLVTGGFIQSHGGFYYPPGVGGSSSAFYAPDGGVTAMSLISIRNDGSNGLTLARTAATAAQYGFKIDPTGNLVLADDTFGTVQRMYMTPAGLFGFGTSVLIDQTGNLTASGAVAALSMSASGGQLNQIHATAGGIRAFRALTSDQAVYLKPFADLTGLESPGGGYGGLSYVGGTQFRVYNPSLPAWVLVDFANIGTVTPGGISGSVQYNNGAGGITGNSVFVWNTAAQRLEVTAAGDVPAIITLQGYIESKTGFLTMDPNSDAIQAPIGGVTAKSLISIRNDGDNGLTLARTTPIAGSYGLRVRNDATLEIWDNTSGKSRVRLYQDGLTQWGDTGTVAIDPAGSISCTGGVYTPLVSVSGTAANTVNIYQGGLRVWLGAEINQAVYLRKYVTDGTPPPGLNPPAAGYGGLAYKGGTQYRVWNETAWVTVDFASMGGGAPGGVSGSIQYNNGAGGFGGNAVWLWNAANQRVDLTGNMFIVGASNVIQLLVQGVSGQTANMQEWRTSLGSEVAAIDKQGNVFGQALVARYGSPNPELTSLTTELRISRKQIRFAQNAGDEAAAGILDYGTIIPNLFVIVGAGPAANRLMRLVDRVTISGTPLTSSLDVMLGYTTSTEGYYTPSGAANAFKAPSGGGTAMSWNSVRDDAGDGLTIMRTASAAATYGFYIGPAGSLNLREYATASTLKCAWSLAGVMYVFGTGYDALTVSNGGLLVALGATINQGLYLKAYPDPGTGLNPPGAGYGGLAYRGGTSYRVWNGTSWVTVDFATVGGGVTSVTGTLNQITATPATGAVVLNLPQNIHTAATPTFAAVYATDNLYVGNTAGATGITFSLDGYNNWFHFIANSANATAGAGIYMMTAGPNEGNGNVRLTIAPNGHVTINQTADWGYNFHVYGNMLVIPYFDTYQSVVYAHSTQTVDIQQWRKYDGTAIAGINQVGSVWGQAIKAFWPSMVVSAIDHLNITRGQIRFAKKAEWETNAGVIDAGGYVDAVLYFLGCGPYPARRIRMSDLVDITGVAGQASFVVTAGYASASEGFHSLSANDKAVNIPNGGVWGYKVVSDTAIMYKAMGGAAWNPPAGYSALMHNTGKMWWAWDSTAQNWIHFDITAGQGPAGYQDCVQFYYAGTFGADANFMWRFPQGALYLGGTLYADARLQVAGITYLGGGSNGDFLSCYVYPDNVLNLQTQIDGTTVSTAPGSGGDNQVLRLQPNGGRIQFGPSANWGYSFDFHGSAFFINRIPGQYSLIVRGAAGQSVANFLIQASDGTELAVSKTNGHFGAQVFVATVNTSASSTAESYFSANELRFKQKAGDDGAAASITHGTYEAGVMCFVGVGTAPNRYHKFWDRMQIVGAGAGAYALLVNSGDVNVSSGAINVNNPNADTQMYVSGMGPRIALGDTVNWASRNVAARWVLCNVSGQYAGHMLTGDTWLFTEGQNGWQPGRIHLGPYPNSTVMIHNSLMQLGGRMIFTPVGAPGAAPAGQAYIFFDGGQLYCRTPSTDYVSLSNPAVATIPTDPTFNTVTSSNWIKSNAAAGAVGLQVASSFYVYGNGNINTNGNFNTTGSYQVNGLTVINASGAFVGNSADIRGGVAAVGFNCINGSGVVQGFGQTWTITFGAPFTINGSGSYTQLKFFGGSLCSAQ